jgi:uncharacterized damage-inducible protein DinB
MNNQNDNEGSTIKSQPAMQWFERKFDLGLGIEQFDGLLDRLAQFPAVLRQALDVCPDAVMAIKPDGKWSVNEHVGHLFLLESLWRKRFQDIKDGLERMSPADLNNTATDEASFNDSQVRDLIERFHAEREKTGLLLQSFSPEDLSKKSIHPRLDRPMTMIDLMYFVAEHDEHHRRAIQEITGKS